MSEENIKNPETEEAPLEKYETTPEAATGFKKKSPPWFDRRKVMMTLSAAFAGIVIMGLVVSTGKESEEKEAAADSGFAANAPREFLQREYERSLRARPEPPEAVPGDVPPGTPLDGIEEEAEEGTNERLPRVVPVSLSENPSRPPPQARPVQQPQYPPPQGGYPARQGNPASAPEPPNPNISPLMARIEGSLFASSSPGITEEAGRPAYPPANPYSPYSFYSEAGSAGQVYPSYPPSFRDEYTAQNDQAGKNDFYNSSSSSGSSGSFLPPDLLWIGTMIPAVLETAINTDLPGNVIARVTENIYDSQTGKKLLIPQGTLLAAKYNNSVSYAQHRVQIVWDQLIRPDGYYLELEGMNGVDPRGMAGLPAEYHENWFEYVKAAGIITMFSLANSKMAEEAERYTNENVSGGIAQANAEFMGQVGGNIVSRAMAIQPTLTVDSGEKINIMLNKNIRLPPMRERPVTQRYSR